MAINANITSENTRVFLESKETKEILDIIFEEKSHITPHDIKEISRLQNYKKMDIEQRKND